MGAPRHSGCPRSGVPTDRSSSVGWRSLAFGDLGYIEPPNAPCPILLSEAQRSRRTCFLQFSGERVGNLNQPHFGVAHSKDLHFWHFGRPKNAPLPPPASIASGDCGTTACARNRPGQLQCSEWSPAQSEAPELKVRCQPNG